MLWISDGWKDYEVLDTSNGERLERWGRHILVRPDPQVIWNTPHSAPEWKRYDARYVRSNTGGGRWTDHDLPERWQIRYKDYLTFNVKPMNFKHTGASTMATASPARSFPCWEWRQNKRWRRRMWSSPRAWPMWKPPTAVATIFTMLFWSNAKCLPTASKNR